VDSRHKIAAPRRDVLGLWIPACVGMTEVALVAKWTWLFAITILDKICGVS
jgi:hypothetical protein